MKFISKIVTISLCVLALKANTQVITSYELKLDSVYGKTSMNDEMYARYEEVWDYETQANNYVYNPSFTRVNDILHVDLSLSFDFNNAYILGTETLKVKAYNLPVDSLILDAKGMLINSVALLVGSTAKPLNFSYNSYQLKIALDKKYTRDENYKILINYVARPNELAANAPLLNPYERGAYFIRPSKYFSHKPLQVWTQGETEDNSVWFPLIDKPNERFTHTLSLRVPDSLLTFSNGIKKSVVKHPDRTRTDVWNMSHDNAAYLVAFVIGDYATTKDIWNAKELNYFVEKPYANSAKNIFAHTPEMLSFFSKKLGVNYPFQAYNQIVVRDYVSGAMENTGAVIFGEFVQRHSNDLKFKSNEAIVAHELFHHWFGNLVTCESWANLPLNESFANYSEYLWFEHKYGRFYADEKGFEEFNSYMNESETKMVDLIRYNHIDRRDMFDSHSYAKGGRILHMLRNYLGDETFFRGLNLYLTQNANKTVEIHNLRLVFEEVSGQDLNWFFNQWFLDSGHPELSIMTEQVDSEVNITVYQQTGTKAYPYFILPVDIDFYLEDGSVTRKNVFINSYDTLLRFEFTQKVLNVNFDAEKQLLGKIFEEKPVEYWAHQWLHAPLFLDKYYALEYLLTHEEYTEKVFLDALKMNSESILSFTLDNIDYVKSSNRAIVNKEIEALLFSNHVFPDVRIKALQICMGFWSSGDALKNLISLSKDEDEELAVFALAYLFINDISMAKDMANQLETNAHPKVLSGLAELYLTHKIPNKFNFYKENIDRSIEIMDEYLMLNYIAEYAIESANEEDINYCIELYEEVLKTECYVYMRLIAYRSLTKIASYYSIQLNNEKADYVNGLYNSYFEKEKDKMLFENLAE